MPKIETAWQRFEDLTSGQLYELLRFRQGIFVVEQRSPYPDLDGFDQSAWHLSARADGELVACLRLIPNSGTAKPPRIGRLAVAARLRLRGIGEMLMTEALLFCRARYRALPIVLSAQHYLVPFYKRFGFEPVSEPYDDFGVAHIDMMRQPGD